MNQVSYDTKVNCSNNYAGIWLATSSANIIEDNICNSNNDTGIYLDYSCENNTVMKNICENNHRYGIVLDSSNNNIMYLNNFISNGDNVRSYSSTNMWNSTEKITYTYRGNTYTSYLGNYWDDYKGTDKDGNGIGIGDTPHRIDSDKDNYPLMKPFENYWLTPPSVGRILPAPYYYQGDTDWCVPTSMSMIFKYYGQNIHSWDIAKDFGWSRDVHWWESWNALPWEVNSYFNNRDLNTETFYVAPLHYPDFDVIKDWIDRDMPVLLSLHSIAHAVVVVGYNLDGETQKVYIDDPSGTLVNDEMKLSKSYPFVAVELNWNELTQYIDCLSYLIAVEGEPDPPNGTIDVHDYGAYFYYAKEPNFPQVYSWLYGLDKGLIWEHFPLHPLALKPEAQFKFDKYITNHLEDKQTYIFEVEFAKYESSVSLWVPTCVIQSPISVDGHNGKSEIIDLVPLRDLLPEYGEYMITLRLWDGMFAEEYDEIVFPIIRYGSD